MRLQNAGFEVVETEHDVFPNAVIGGKEHSSLLLNDKAGLAIAISGEHSASVYDTETVDVLLVGLILCMERDGKSQKRRSKARRQSIPRGR